MKEILTNCESETLEFATEFAKCLKKGDIVGLIGELGSGKTLFVKGIGKYFGINPEEIVSPSFVIINEYLSDKMKIFHFDLYRIESEIELENLGYEEYLFDDGITLIEWPEKFEKILKYANYLIYIEYLKENTRKIKIKKNK